MPRQTTIKLLRTNKTNLDAQKAISNLIVGEPYFISDNTSKLALATAVNDYETYYNSSEIDSKLNLFTRITGLTSLAIDCSTADIFEVSLSANASFSLTNVPTNKEKKFIITNSGASEITITYPNTADYWESATFKIAAGKKKITALEFNGTTRFWYLSTEMKNA